eukprot:6014285-Amphidinium_carterae.3
MHHDAVTLRTVLKVCTEADWRVNGIAAKAWSLLKRMIYLSELDANEMDAGTLDEVGRAADAYDIAAGALPSHGSSTLEPPNLTRPTGTVHLRL